MEEELISVGFGDRNVGGSAFLCRSLDTSSTIFRCSWLQSQHTDFFSRIFTKCREISYPVTFFEDSFCMFLFIRYYFLRHFRLSGKLVTFRPFRRLALRHAGSLSMFSCIVYIFLLFSSAKQFWYFLIFFPTRRAKKTFWSATSFIVFCNTYNSRPRRAEGIKFI